MKPTTSSYTETSVGYSHRKTYNEIMERTMTATTKYITGAEDFPAFKPKPGDLCEGIYNKMVARMVEDRAVQNVILLGEHFDPRNSKRGKETFASIEVLLISTGDNKTEYYDKYHANYVFDLWDLGVEGSIKALSAKEMHDTGGLYNWLTGKTPEFKNIPQPS